MAGYVSGPTLNCLSCGSPNLKLITERLDTYDGIYVASIQCMTCLCQMLDSRRGKQKRPYDQNGLIRAEELSGRAASPPVRKEG